MNIATPVDAKTKGQVNREFLESLSSKARNEIITSIANHYGTDNNTIYEELIDPEAHQLLEYMVEPMRGATLLLMQRTGYCHNTMS